jgi:outer membrane immunogenic protein
MRIAALIASIIVGLGIGSARAADFPSVPLRAPVAAPIFNWTGFYAGIHGGWGWGDADRTLGANDELFGSGIGSHEIDGGIFGGHMGFNWQLSPNWLVGLEASIAWSGMDGSVAGAAPTSIHTDVDWIASATPRLGWTSNNWLFYVKGGVAGARAGTTAVEPTAGVFTAKNSFLGWTVGAGLEVLAGPNWVFGVEYNYYDLGQETIGGVYSTVLPAAQSAELKFSTVLARLSYKY